MKVSAIIAAYNEEPTIGKVVRALKSSPLVSEIIVISDGSRDKTALRAREAGADIVHELPVRRGKGAAISHGVTHSDAPILLFSDADLVGFTREHVQILLEPVLRGEFSMCIGLRDRGKFVTKVSRYLPLIGGERALQRKIFENVPTKYLRGFMLEEALNYYCRSRKLPFGTRALKGLKIIKKMEKVGFWKGLIEYFKMSFQIIKAIIVVRLARLLKEF